MFALRKGQPAVILAPMEGVTDAPMRELQSERAGFDLCVSEFIRVSQDVVPTRTFLDEVPELRRGARTKSGVPVQVQLLGGDPDRLALSALKAIGAGAFGIDLNFGCPAPTVNRHDGGATLLKYPERIYAIVHAVRAAVPKEMPVSAKFRLGWDSIDPIHRNADEAARAGASWITIHGRTRMQGYQPPAYWDPIGQVRRSLDIPVVANGEIWSIDDFRRCRDATGCDHYMLGRSALVDPDLPILVRRELGLGAEHALAASRFLGPEISFDEPSPAWVPLFDRYAEITRAYTDHRDYLERKVKQWLNLARMQKKIGWFDSVKRLDSWAAIRAVLDAAACIETANTH